MQRSLLPQKLPEVSGLEVGAVYESSARVDVGGDVYDFLVLPDGRLAAVLGDVAGHGIEATADMALAKFVFARWHASIPSRATSSRTRTRSCTRSWSAASSSRCCTSPSTRSNEIAAARAGHPPARLIDSSGRFRSSRRRAFR